MAQKLSGEAPSPRWRSCPAWTEVSGRAPSPKKFVFKDFNARSGFMTRAP